MDYVKLPGQTDGVQVTAVWLKAQLMWRERGSRRKMFMLAQQLSRLK